MCYNCAFSAYDQAHGDALCFIVVRLVEQVGCAQASAEPEGRTESFSGGASGNKWAHERIGFAVASVSYTHLTLPTILLV